MSFFTPGAFLRQLIRTESDPEQRRFYTCMDEYCARRAFSMSHEDADARGSPLIYFSRNRKLPADKLIGFLIAEGSSTTKNELLDFFGMSNLSPSSSAFFQQREKLKPEALKDVFDNFSRAVSSCADKHHGYRIIAADL